MKKGFTLAEVLITLGIVGIVAVLTVPAVMKNYRNRMYVAQLKKVSAQIQDAARSMMNDEHTDHFTETKATMIDDNCIDPDSDEVKVVCNSGMEYFLTNYFKTINVDCLAKPGMVTPPCAYGDNSKYYKLDGTKAKSGFWGYCIQTTNGATICGFYNTTSKRISVAVDVNGMAEPNTIGRDLFTMDILDDGRLADYASNAYPGGCGPDMCGVGYGEDGGVYNEACGCYSKVSRSGWKMEY